MPVKRGKKFPEVRLEVVGGNANRFRKTKNKNSRKEKRTNGHTGLFRKYMNSLSVNCLFAVGCFDLPAGTISGVDGQKSMRGGGGGGGGTVTGGAGRVGWVGGGCGRRMKFRRVPVPAAGSAETRPTGPAGLKHAGRDKLNVAGRGGGFARGAAVSRPQKTDSNPVPATADASVCPRRAPIVPIPRRARIKTRSAGSWANHDGCPLPTVFNANRPRIRDCILIRRLNIRSFAASMTILYGALISNIETRTKYK